MSLLRNQCCRALAALLFLTGVCSIQQANAQQPPDEILVDVTLRDADLLTATRMLTQRTGLQFVIEPSAEPFGKITLQLAKQPANVVIDYICKAAGAYSRRDENGVYIISRNKPIEPKATDAAGSNAKKATVFRKIRLQKADAREVYEQLLDINEYDATRVFREMSRFNGSIPNSDPMNVENVQGPVNLSPETYAPAPIRRFSTPRASGEAANEVVLPGESANLQIGGGGGQFGGGGQGGGGIGGQGGGGGGGQGIQLSGGFVPPGIDVFAFDPTDNSLVVQGTEEAINALIRIISEFDRAPKQVLIKVEFITTSSTNLRSIGYDFQYQRGTIFFGVEQGTFARTGDPFFLSYSSGNIVSRLRANLQESRSRVVQAPIVRTLNNQPASVFVRTNTTIFITTVSQNPNSNISFSNPVTLTITTGLAVTPRINNDGTITMFLAPTVQDFGQIRRGPNGQEVPDTVQQSLAVVARVKNGESIALGGLNRRDDAGSGAKYPILGDLPLIGQFFRTSSRSRNMQELLIFVTPTIIEDEDYGGLGA